jgi:HEPN domain-containing protein
MENNYFDIGKTMYSFCMKNQNVGENFNNILAVNCQQACEMLLKAVVSIVEPESIKTYKLEELNSTLIKNDIDFKLDAYKLATISSYYNDARKPCDTFVNVKPYMIRDCYTVMQNIYQQVNRWMYMHNSKDIKYKVESNESKQVDDELIQCARHTPRSLIDIAIDAMKSN